MTIIVKHRRTGNEYILLGINGELGKVNPSRFISELFTPDKSELSCSVTVCDIRGNIFLAYIDDLLVTEIDGKKLTDILPEPSFEQVNNDVYSDTYQQQDNFDDEEDLVEENLDYPKNPRNTSSISDQPLSSPDDSQGDLKQDEFPEDDEDWI